MPKKIKSKARLDKWYHIAKEQGYRSRAAFKLIQLNRKYNFLNSANTLVDLCAAPGGWLQVATRYMPVSSIKIGIDLDKIKNVPGCITFQEDITTPRCLALIKKEIRSEKVDVVLNDGAPNVGANWSKDAFSQVELVLAALKLAATVLRRGGTFVTKVFRSTDYNSLIWVLNKFFEKVEATKPAASRTQSAEIFIVCLRYIAPDYIDPKLFDTKFVFKDTEEDLLKESEADKITSIDKLLDSQKKKNRTGYDTDAPITMHKIISFEDFLHIDNPLLAFAKYNKISFTKEDEAKYLHLAPVPEDYKDVMEDLRVLGKRELQSLVKWRTKVLNKVGRQTKKTGKEAEGIEEVEEEKEEDKPAGDHDTDSELEEEIKKEKVRELKELKRQKGKKLEQLAKLGERAPGTVIADADELNYDFTKSKRNIEKIGYVDVDEDEEEFAPIEKKKKTDAQEVEDNLEMIYELTKKKAAKVESNRVRKIEAKQRKKMGEDFDEEQFRLELIQEQKDIEIEEESHKIRKDRNVVDDVDGDDEEDDDDDIEEEVNGIEAQNMGAVAEKYLAKSKWFDRDIFKQGIKSAELESISKSKNPLKLTKRKENKKGAAAEEEKEEPKKNADAMEEENNDEDFEDVNEDEQEETAQTKKKKKAEKLKITTSMQGKEKRKRKIKADALAGFGEIEQEKDNGKIEIVPALRYDDYDVDSLAQMRVLAGKMLRKKDREDLIEDSYNRYSRHVDEDAPDWFIEEENKHNYKILPISKEEFAAEKSKLLAIKNKPIKKIVEAKIRRKFQVAKKLKKAESRAADIMEQEGVSEVSKLKQVKSLYRKALKNKKIEKKYVVAKAGGVAQRTSRGKKGTGKTVMVDRRMKKEKRAEKRLEKKGRGKNSKPGTGEKAPKRKGSKKRQIKRH